MQFTSIWATTTHSWHLLLLPPAASYSSEKHHHHRLRALILAASPLASPFARCLLFSLLFSLLSLAFFLAFSLACLLLLSPFARLAHLNVFSWHLHRHSIRLISFSCHSQWVDESLGCLSPPALLLLPVLHLLVCSCLLLCGRSYCMLGRFGSSCVFLITFN